MCGLVKWRCFNLDYPFYKRLAQCLELIDQLYVGIWKERKGTKGVFWEIREEYGPIWGDSNSARNCKGQDKC